jgi:iron complex outermembrane receptor protein
VTVFKGNVPNRAGTPSFGGAIDINTNKLIFQPFVMLKTQFGSYNSLKYSIHANSGLLDNKYNFEIGLSRQKSDGYIDRSDADLKSFRISGAIIRKNYSFRLNYIHGSERTGQAWNGLPIQYDGIDSLRTYNTAGTERSGEPYEDEKDNYKQDHIQLFYQNQLTAKTTLNTSLNYTIGSGYYENYKSAQNLSDYFLESAISTNADLIKRQWLENNFIYVNTGLQYNASKKLVFYPSISWSYYNGDHFGQVAKALLADYRFLKNHYYDNNGLKKEFSTCIKTIYNASNHLKLSLDLQYRIVHHNINGQLEFSDSLSIDKSYHLFNPKIFGEYALNDNWKFYSSIGFMGREPFREDLIGADSNLKPEELMDVELGTQFVKGDFDLKLNGYWMNYHQQLALSGRINDVGEALRINLGKSYRLGLELEMEYDLSDWLSLWLAGNLSTNKISEINEFIPDYDASYNLLGYVEVLHSKTNISFSPSEVIQEGISVNILKEKKSSPGLILSISHNYVSDFYIDNYNKESSLLRGYNNFDCTLSMQKSYSKIGTLRFWFTVYNLNNEKYSSHGWISRERHEEPIDLSSSPYLGQESKAIYFYKGLYPQALRHFNIGVSLKFH